VSWSEKIPVRVFVAPTIYLGLCVAVALEIVPAEGSWGWFLPFLAAFPFSIVLLPLTNVLPPFLTFGIFGTLWWFLIGKMIAAAITRAAARMGRAR
jgi:hypothetical protein